jgi:hypothetical protein
MSDTIRVVVAPGATITIRPHPSGLQALPSLTLYGGDTLDVSEAEARRLYDAGRILSPTTGRPKPLLPAAPPQVRFSLDGGPLRAPVPGNPITIPTAHEGDPSGDSPLRRQGLSIDPVEAAVGLGPLPDLPKGW